MKQVCPIIVGMAEFFYQFRDPSIAKLFSSLYERGLVVPAPSLTLGEMSDIANHPFPSNHTFHTRLDVGGINLREPVTFRARFQKATPILEDVMNIPHTNRIVDSVRTIWHEYLGRPALLENREEDRTQLVGFGIIPNFIYHPELGHTGALRFAPLEFGRWLEPLPEGTPYGELSFVLRCLEPESEIEPEVATFTLFYPAEFWHPEELTGQTIVDSLRDSVRETSPEPVLSQRWVTLLSRMGGRLPIEARWAIEQGLAEIPVGNRQAIINI